ncbi:MAG: helix-turn-helix domain-containing protein [Bacillota bacterium]|nr:helix-turn-helix domain-containing protein [Bacillota bacterium]
MSSGKPARPRKRPTFEELPEVMKVQDAARYLGVAPSTIYEAVRRGEFPALRLGQRVVISRWHLAQALGIGEEGERRVVVSPETRRPA